jgi:hypothetical protein
LRLLLPCRGRGRGFRRLAVVALAAVLAGCGGSGDAKKHADETPTPTPVPTPALTDALEHPAPDSLAAGITEPNANLVWAGHPVPEPFARWRDALAELHPAVYRLVLYWPAVQPDGAAPPDLNALNGGCMRELGPCAPFAGVRDQLRALASRQKQSGWEALVVVAGAPDWAARAPSGCERSGTAPRNRMPRSDALAAYRELVKATLAAAEQEGARLRYWSPWNEPNHPYSSSPQRAACSGSARSVSAAPYVEVAGALRRALDEAPGDQRYVVGELAALVSRKRSTTTVAEFARALPADLVCGAVAWSQHAYIGGADVLGDVDAALNAKGCGDKPVWITETGAGAARTGTARGGGAAGERRGCEALHRQLEAWYRDPRVTLAVQYTLREDDKFPTGLVTTDLARAYPALAEWRQWGMEARPRSTDPAPAGAACG